jgi:small-conductance mechanosensitive channel
MALLNRYQKNRLTIVLRMLEDELDLVRELASADSREKILSRSLNALPRASQQKVDDLIEAAKKIIGQLAQRFDLEKSNVNSVAVANAYLSTLWVMLCDTNAKGLAGYGKVDEKLSGELDPSIKELIDLVTQMKNVLLSHSPDADTKVKTGSSASKT